MKQHPSSRVPTTDAGYSVANMALPARSDLIRAPKFVGFIPLVTGARRAQSPSTIDQEETHFVHTADTKTQ